MSSSSTPTSNSILSKPSSSSSSSQFIYSSPPSYGDASSAVYSSTGSYFPLPFHLQKPGQQSVSEQQNHLIPQYQNQYPQIPPPQTVAKIPTSQHVYPAPASVAAGMYSLPQYQQAQQLFQRDAQKITPEALESVKAALANSEIEHKAETKKKAIPRKAAGQSWEDPTLAEWPENDYRLFCGDLGNEVNDEVLSKAFSRFASFNMARVVRDKRTGKTRGYGFVSFANPLDLALAMKEMNGKYVGNRPIKLRKSNWKERTDVEALEKQKNHTQKKPKLPKKSVLHK